MSQDPADFPENKFPEKLPDLPNDLPEELQGNLPSSAFSSDYAEHNSAAFGSDENARAEDAPKRVASEYDPGYSSPSEPDPYSSPDPYPTSDTTAEATSEDPANPQGEDPLAEIQQFSEKMSAAQAVPAAFPFSLSIEGPLTEREREKLLDLLTRENMGIREVELEPQFDSGRILLPRISEYAGVLIVQALRGTRAQLRLGPSDTIFATEETRDESLVRHDLLHPAKTEESRYRSSEGKHPAELIRISADPSIPDLPDAMLIDLVMASTTLQSQVVEAKNSSKYQEVLDALIRELKYKAYRKEAVAIVNFSIELFPLSLPTEYKLLVKGSAVKNAAI